MHPQSPFHGLACTRSTAPRLGGGTLVDACIALPCHSPLHPAQRLHEVHEVRAGVIGFLFLDRPCPWSFWSTCPWPCAVPACAIPHALRITRRWP